MKKLLITAAILSTLIAANANASSSVASPTQPQTTAQSGQKFDQRKAKILQKIGERQACVQAATDETALKACKPEGKGKTS